MENPWANAWADSAKSSLPEPSPTWAAPSVSTLHADHEDDLSTPSWPKEPVPDWSPTDPAADVMWTVTDTASVWNPLPSGFDKIALGKKSDTDSPKSLSVDLKDEEVRSSLQPAASPEAPARLEVEPLTTSPVNPPAVEKEVGWTTNKSRTSSLVPIPPNISIPPSEDPDVFGSFETGEDAPDKDSWTPAKPTFPSVPSADVSTWDSAWQQPPSADCGPTDEQDAWELARREKEVQDRHVPPELLASILQQLETLSEDLWTDEIPITEADNEFNTKFELDHSSLLQRLAPEDLVLPPKSPFQNTFTSKQLSESLKLTRNLLPTRSSPMAMYMASKGSTSWEASIKARPTVAPDDVTPPGWRILETAKESESPVEDEKKRSGLFSFFGRRAASSSTSPNRTVSPGVTMGDTSIRNQISRSSSDNTQPTETRVGSPVSLKTPSETATISKFDAQPSLFASSSVDGSTDETQHEAPTQSVVSRFLGRISGRPTKPQSRDSLALTSDDLEFLADVPTANSNAETSDRILDMNSLNIMLKPTPPPETLPLPLPPPPSRKATPLPLPPAVERPSQPVISGDDDLFSLLDTSDSNPVPSLRPSSINPTKHTTSLSLPTSIPIHPPENSIRSDVAKSSVANGVTGKAQSQPRSLRPPLVAIKPAVASPIDTTDSKKAISTQLLSSLKPSMGQSSSSTGFKASPTEQLSAPSNQDEEDDFSDFLSSPPIQNSQFDSFSLGSFPATTPSASPINTSNDDFGDFGDVFGPLNPPPPPVKTPATFMLSPPNSNNRLLPPMSTQPGASHFRKSSRKADHSRTLSLLEAASTRGRWLSPPSPIPEALSPPPDGSFPKSSSDGYLAGRSGSMQAQQSRILASFETSSSSPAISSNNASGKIPQPWQPAPPSVNLLVPSATSIQTLAPVPARPQPFPLEQKSTASSQSTKRIGGLSAQDLSFFEGL